MKQPKTTLFLTTYNWPEALSLCLQSIAAQTHLPDEVIIADDGSTEATRLMIDSFKDNYPCPLIHVWQEDKGFRINTIRNKAIERARHPYIIQIDGDVILDKHFVADHLRFARPGRLVAGRRIRINKEETEEACKTLSYSTKQSTRCQTLAILHQHLLYNSKSVRGVRGCNMSYWKDDAYRVNGYDEEWIGKGPDDKEYAIRMTYAGVSIYNLKFYALQHHLNHGEEGLLDNYALNQKHFAETMERKAVQCKAGIKKEGYS
ncbi:MULTISPECIES: glycosyltransferase family 2 protein [unclassified Carboxylicivirga]|uniref:glycosyltransferase family 2 protein n=1 Tax=Carboxylicivirga TaxID=1628153 RepID=UPI003D343129